MPIAEIFIYIGTFVALYFGILVFVTMAENRRKFYITRPLSASLPTVSIILPCFNEEDVVEDVLNSLANIEYPPDKLELIVVDDGSYDATLAKITAFQATHPALKVLHKENGGKYTALNLAIPQARGDFIGTIDADCLVEPSALKQMLRYFDEPRVAAVVSTIKVRQPKNIIEGIQYVEFEVSGFIKKILSFLGSLSVTPGPLSLFRKETFSLVGPYKKAYLTEDLEMALRIQSHHLKIACSWEAAVYTKAEPTLKLLFRQRLRWQRGFVLNFKDYLGLLNFRTHGNLSFLLIYSAIGVFLSVVSILIILAQISQLLFAYFTHAWLVKFDLLPLLSLRYFNWERLYLDPTILFSLLVIIIMLGFLFLGRKFTFAKNKLDEKIVFWVIVYPFLNATWWMLTTASVISGKKIEWK